MFEILPAEFIQADTQGRFIGDICLASVLESECLKRAPWPRAVITEKNVNV